MKVFAKVVLAIFFVCTIFVLQGCGCDKDKVAKCTVTGTSICVSYSTCLNDASCCDYEENGGKAKDVAVGFCTATPGDNKCA